MARHSLVSKPGKHSQGKHSREAVETRRAAAGPGAAAREGARGAHSAGAHTGGAGHAAMGNSQGTRAGRNAAAPAAATSGASAAVALPRTAEIRAELDRTEHRSRAFGALRSTVFILIVVAAAAALTAVMLLPVLRIYGDSMESTLDTGDIVVSVKTSDFHTGDVMAFYYNNNVLVKRVIAQSGDWVNIDSQGNVFVNGQQIEEPYLSSKALGETNITLPYQVPEGKVFVMGDNRAVSIDSRNTAVGCISSEQIVGRIVFRVWPLPHFGPVS